MPHTNLSYPRPLHTHAPPHVPMALSSVNRLPASWARPFQFLHTQQGVTSSLCNICRHLPPSKDKPGTPESSTSGARVLLPSARTSSVCLWPPYLPNNSPHPGEALSHLFSNAHLLLKRAFLFFLRLLLRVTSCFLVIQAQHGLELPWSLYLLNIKDLSSQMFL